MQLIFIVFCLPQTREKRAAATAPPREMVTLSLSSWMDLKHVRIAQSWCSKCLCAVVVVWWWCTMA